MIEFRASSTAVKPGWPASAMQSDHAAISGITLGSAMTEACSLLSASNSVLNSCMSTTSGSP